MEILLRKRDLKKLHLSGRNAILYFGDGFFRLKLCDKNKSIWIKPKLSTMKIIIKSGLL